MRTHWCNVTFQPPGGLWLINDVNVHIKQDTQKLVRFKNSGQVLCWWNMFRTNVDTGMSDTQSCEDIVGSSALWRCVPGCVPLDPLLSSSLEGGGDFMKMFPESAAFSAITNICHTLLDTLGAAWWFRAWVALLTPRIFMRWLNYWSTKSDLFCLSMRTKHWRGCILWRTANCIYILACNDWYEYFSQEIELRFLHCNSFHGWSSPEYFNP